MSNSIVEKQKSQNIKTILHIIRRSDGISKNAIKELTGLSFATVSTICNELVIKNILKEEKSTAERISGRIPKQLSLERRAYYAICLDFQNLGIIDVSIQDIAKGTVLSKVERYHSPLEVNEVLRRIHTMIMREAQVLNIHPSRFIGVGASIAGIFDKKTETIEECAIPQWDGLNLKYMLQSIFEMPAYVDNEANLCVSQLLSYPSLGENSQNVVYLHIGEGIGVGVIEDGKLLSGETGYAAEISHLPIGNKRIQCSRCGNYGCAETELSKTGFIKKYTELRNIPTASIDWDTFVRAVKSRDPLALQVMRENAELIADCVITLMMLFDPKEFYIGGSILDVYEYTSKTVESKIGRLGSHYVRIPVLLESRQAQALTNGIVEMLIWRWEPFLLQ